jgi:hypothetical protein
MEREIREGTILLALQWGQGLIGNVGQGKGEKVSEDIVRKNE